MSQPFKEKLPPSRYKMSSTAYHQSSRVILVDLDSFSLLPFYLYFIYYARTCEINILQSRTNSTIYARSNVRYLTISFQLCFSHHSRSTFYHIPAAVCHFSAPLFPHRPPVRFLVAPLVPFGLTMPFFLFFSFFLLFISPCFSFFFFSYFFLFLSLPPSQNEDATVRRRVNHKEKKLTTRGGKRNSSAV